ncbi:MAG: ferredoxin--NADP reductase [Bacteroidota bacterium]
MPSFYPLVVEKIRSLTPNSVAVTFAVPKELLETFEFIPGQYITIKKEIGGQELRRAYSISSVPKTNTFTIGIKKVKDGRFSSYANDQLAEGDILEIMPPEGRFTYTPAENPVNMAAFAAGSGITPIMSIIQAVLEGHPKSSFVLVYGNQSQEETMFYGELVRLQEDNTDRFFIHFVNSRARGTDTIFGRIERSTVNFVLKNKHKDTAFDAYYLCGPEAMIHTIGDTLKDNGVAPDDIHFELFSTPKTKEEDDLSKESTSTVGDGKTQLSVILDDEEFTFGMDRETLILDAVLNENIDAPYSCQGGVCSSCIARVTEGKAKMVKNQILTDGEVEEGFILTCQAYPLTPTLKVDFDDV